MNLQKHYQPYCLLQNKLCDLAIEKYRSGKLSFDNIFCLFWWPNFIPGNHFNTKYLFKKNALNPQQRSYNSINLKSFP